MNEFENCKNCGALMHKNRSVAMSREEVLETLELIHVFCTDCPEDKHKIDEIIEAVRKQPTWVS